MSKLRLFFILLVPGFFLPACEGGREGPLPVMGNKYTLSGDTVYHEIADFRFVNQDSQWVTNTTFEDKIYLADFFFTSCPTICPKVKKQMLRLYDKYEQDSRVLLLSHSIDVKRDTVGHLKQYASNLGVKTEKWHFVTGLHDEIYEMADDYFSTAKVDAEAPGGFDHSGLIILVDANRHIRAYCDGTDPEAVNQFMEDIDKLLREEYTPVSDSIVN